MQGSCYEIRFKTSPSPKRLLHGNLSPIPPLLTLRGRHSPALGEPQREGTVRQNPLCWASRVTLGIPSTFQSLSFLVYEVATLLRPSEALSACRAEHRNGIKGHYSSAGGAFCGRHHHLWSLNGDCRNIPYTHIPTQRWVISGRSGCPDRPPQSLLAAPGLAFTVNKYLDSQPHKWPQA